MDRIDEIENDPSLSDKEANQRNLEPCNEIKYSQKRWGIRFFTLQIFSN